LLSILQFFPGISSFKALANEVTIFQNIFLSTTHLFHCILFVLTLGNKLIFCTDPQIPSPHISRMLTNKALPFFSNVTCTFPSSFLLTRQEIDLEFSKYLESRGDKCRDLKNESTTLKFEKQNCNLFHPSKRAHSVQNKFLTCCL